MIALKCLKVRQSKIDTHKVNNRSCQAAVWRYQMQYIEILRRKYSSRCSEEIHTLLCPVSSCGVAKKLNRCMQNLQCNCMCSISLGSVECLWSDVTDGFGKKLGDGTWAGRSNHGGQEWAIRWPAHKERALTNSCQVDLTQADLTSYPPPRPFMPEPTGRHR